MYNLDQVRVLEIETTNVCNASCPQCLRTNEQNPELVQFHDELDFEKVKQNIPASFWRQLERINFNGTTGDNIAHPRIKSIVTEIQQLAPQASIKISTNGSLRSIAWWTQLGALLRDTNCEVIFALDGLRDTHSLYRVGTNWDKVIDNARAFILGGGRATWQMLVFEHNQHQVNECKELARTMGFSNFFTRIENRFPSGQSEQPVFFQGQQTHVIKPTSLKADMENPWSSTLTPVTKGISCLSQSTKWLSIYADGTLWPCCFLMGWHKSKHQRAFTAINYHFKKILDIDFEKISLYTNTIQDIVASNLWQKNYPDSFIKAPNPVCVQQCSK